MPAMFSCTYFYGPQKIPLAKVGEEILYLTEVQSVIPTNIASEDSILLAEDYIQKWIRTELLIKKAQENLTLAQRDVSKELEEYRNSLIIYRYQKELMAEKLDTTVSFQELTSFYNKNKENFTLGNDLVKAIYIKIPLQVSQPERAKAFCENTSGESLRELQVFCARYAVNYDFYTENWVDAGDIFQNLPDAPDDVGSFISKNPVWETRDARFYYLICIQNYRLKGSEAPMEYIHDNIKNLIINERKTNFLKKVEDDVYTEGVRNNKFKIYEYETN
jgi:hypothetical protein